MIPNEAVEAIHAAICEESLEDHMDPQWPGRCVKAAQAAAPYLMAQAWDRGETAGRSYAMRIMSDEARAPKPTNPYSFMRGPV
jgi:hypothetical protein